MGKFLPGQSGNPNGRPRQKPFLDWCKDWITTKGRDALCKIAEDPDHKQQLEAIKTIYAYGIGKPVEFSEASHQVESVRANPDEALSILESIIPGAAVKGIRASDGNESREGAGPDEVPSSQRGAEEGNP